MHITYTDRQTKPKKKKQSKNAFKLNINDYNSVGVCTMHTPATFMF